MWTLKFKAVLWSVFTHVARICLNLSEQKNFLHKYGCRNVLWIRSIVFTIAFSAAVNRNYDHKQGILKHRNTQNGSKWTNHRSQTMTFWTHLSKVLFPERSSKMIDSSEKRKHQLAFELRVRVFLKSAVESQRHYFSGFVNILFWNVPRWTRYAAMAIDEKTYGCKKTPAKSHPAATLRWWTRNLFSGQSEAGNSNAGKSKCPGPGCMKRP